MVFIAISVVAVTEFLKRLNARDFQGAGVILAAALIGLLAGLNHLDGLTTVNGVIAGLTAAGVHTVATRVG